MNNTDNILPFQVSDLGFLVDRVGQDCHDLQFLRELTQNSLEAVHRSGKSGQVIWDVDPTYYKQYGTTKLRVIDTGEGMTAEDLLKFINQLSSSSSNLSLSGNFGVGAKIATASRNPAGIVFASWKFGKGNLVLLCRDNKGQYGLKQWRLSDGSFTHVLPISDDPKPSIIGEHGTTVTLLGDSPEANTVHPPNQTSNSWIEHYLNIRYFRFHADVSVEVRADGVTPQPCFGETATHFLTGQEPWLQRHSEASGSIMLKNGRAHWWILKNDIGLHADADLYECGGHVAALHQNEIYEMSKGRSGASKLQNFGVTFGLKQVVIYVEPLVSAGFSLTTNTARTSLLGNNEPLPWAEWAEEFRSKMPTKLKAFVESIATHAISGDRSKSIRSRVLKVWNQLLNRRYRVDASGKAEAGNKDMLHNANPPRHRADRNTPDTGTEEPATKRTQNIYALFEKCDGRAAEESVEESFPTANWVSTSNGTRTEGDIEDRAAKYIVASNRLLINADYRGFSDLKAVCVHKFGSAPGREAVAEAAIRNWCEQTLIEAIIGIQSLRKSKDWNEADIEHSLSPEALTTAVMPRYHTFNAVMRELRSVLGSPTGAV